ncbi:MAG: secretin N-terminal domain-containing protein, partial [Opitutaceae bacterium]
MQPTLRLLPLAALVLILAFEARAATAAASPDLLQARADLVERFKSGQTDESNAVKQLRAKIVALEFIAQNSPAGGDTEPRLISVNFPGGPFSALVAAADKNSASGFNVVGEKADLAVELPPFSIRNADASALANALDGLLQPRGYTLQQQSSRAANGPSPVFFLRKRSASDIAYEQSQLAQRTGHFQSFQLGSYIGEQTVEDIVGAIRTAWELDPAHNSAALRLKFHPPTGILLVSGPPEGINLVQIVLSQLRRNSSPNGATARTPRCRQSEEVTVPSISSLPTVVLPLSASGSEPSALAHLTAGLAAGSNAVWTEFHRDYGP